MSQTNVVTRLNKMIQTLPGKSTEIGNFDKGRPIYFNFLYESISSFTFPLSITKFNFAKIFYFLDKSGNIQKMTKQQAVGYLMSEVKYFVQDSGECKV